MSNRLVTSLAALAIGLLVAWWLRGSVAAEERDDARIERATQKAKDALDSIDAILGNQFKILKLAEGTCSTAKDLRRAVTDALEEIDDALEA